MKQIFFPALDRLGLFLLHLKKSQENHFHYEQTDPMHDLSAAMQNLDDLSNVPDVQLQQEQLRDDYEEGRFYFKSRFKFILKKTTPYWEPIIKNWNRLP